MSESTAAPASSTAGATAIADGAPADATTTATDSGTNPEGASTTNEELFDVQVGKDQSGNPIIKKFNKADLLKHAGMGVSAHEKFEAAKKTQAQIQQLAKLMKDPDRVWEVLQKLGHDTDKLLDKRVNQILADAALDPKDRELRDVKGQLERFLKQEEAQKQAAQAARQKALVEQYQTAIQQKISGALTAAHLPDSKSNRAAAAQIISQLYNFRDESGNQPYTDPTKIPEDKVVQYLKATRVDGLKSLVDGADGETLLSLLPEDLVNKIAAALSQKLQGTHGKVNNEVPAPTHVSSNKNKRQVKTAKQVEAEIKNNIAKAQAAWERRQMKR